MSPVVLMSIQNIGLNGNTLKRLSSNRKFICSTEVHLHTKEEPKVYSLHIKMIPGVILKINF